MENDEEDLASAAGARKGCPLLGVLRGMYDDNDDDDANLASADAFAAR